MSGIPEDSAAHPNPVLDAYVERHATAGHWPGAAYAVGPPAEEPAWTGAAGALALVPAREPARTDALYDLASLTKPLATAAIALRLADRGALDPDRPLDDLLPEMRGYAGRTPSVADLLLHRSGVPAWLPLYRLAADPSEVPAVIAAWPPAAPAGTTPIYSCPGPILAAIALERGTGRPFRALFEDEVVLPLGLAGEIGFGPVDGARARCAPTEIGRVYEDGLARETVAGHRPTVERDDLVPGPAEPVRGIVHDGNAAFLGGVAGNAGLFGTARAVFRIGSSLAVPGRFLGADAVQRVTRVGIAAVDDARTFGFRHGSGAAALAGAFGADSFGHVGFTGTSLWIGVDPPAVAVLLTNRVHPRREDVPMQAWRREFHDEVEALVRREWS